MVGSLPLKPIDPTSFPGWDERIADHPEATVFHTSAWARVLSTAYGYLPIYFIALENDRLIAIVPFMEIRSWITGTRGVSLPFTDECSPILPEGQDWPETVRLLAEKAECSRWRTMEFRGCLPGMGTLPASEEFLTHVLDLTAGEEQIISRYRPNVRKNIRKSHKEAITIVKDKTQGGMMEFYRLNCLTRREHGLPPQPLRFFEILRKFMLEKEFGTLLLARHQGEAIAGAIFLHFGKKAIYKYGASDRRYQQLRANNLVFQEGIHLLGSRGIRILSFGRTDLHNDGLRRFKLSWGAKEKRLQYICYDLRSKSWLANNKKKNISVGSIFTRMPLPILRFIGSIAYRHIG